MNRFHTLVAMGIAWMGAMSAPALSATPQIISATVDYAHNLLNISGKNLGLAPVITLSTLTFPTQSSTSTRIVAGFPDTKPPSNFKPGTYFLTLQFTNQPPMLLTVDIGVQGPVGAPGPPGPGVDPAVLQQIAALQAQLDLLRQAVAVGTGGTTVQVTATTNLDVVAGANKTETVGASSQSSVGTSRTSDVGANDTLTVAGDQNDSVGGDQGVLVGGDQNVNVGKNQSVDVGGDQSIDVTGKQTVRIGTDQNVAVGGNVVQRTSKSMQFRGLNGALISMDSLGNISIKTNGDITMEAGNDINIKASGDVVLKGENVLQN